MNKKLLNLSLKLAEAITMPPNVRPDYIETSHFSDTTCIIPVDKKEKEYNKDITKNKKEPLEDID